MARYKDRLKDTDRETLYGMVVAGLRGSIASTPVVANAFEALLELYRRAAKTETNK